MDTTKLRRSIARLFQQHPRVAAVLHSGYRMIQPRFTVGVVGVVVNAQGQVLLVEHVFHAIPWGFPGGWIDRGEDPSACVRREIQEELGLTVEVERELLVRLTGRSHLDFAYLCRPTGEVSALSPELLSYGWYNLAETPPLVEFQQLVMARLLAERRTHEFSTERSDRL